MMIHCGATEILPDEAIFETLATFKSEGRIRAIGASVYGAEAALAAITMADMSVFRSRTMFWIDVPNRECLPSLR